MPSPEALGETGDSEEAVERPNRSQEHRESHDQALYDDNTGWDAELLRKVEHAGDALELVFPEFADITEKEVEEAGLELEQLWPSFADSEEPYRLLKTGADSIQESHGSSDSQASAAQDKEHDSPLIEEPDWEEPGQRAEEQPVDQETKNETDSQHLPTQEVQEPEQEPREELGSRMEQEEPEQFRGTSQEEVEAKERGREKLLGLEEDQAWPSEERKPSELGNAPSRESHGYQHQPDESNRPQDSDSQPAWEEAGGVWEAEVEVTPDKDAAQFIDTLEPLISNPHSPPIIRVDLIPGGGLSLRDAEAKVWEALEQRRDHLSKLGPPDHEVHLGDTGGTIFIWRRDAGPDSWLKAYSQERIYLADPADKSLLIDRARRNLKATEKGLNDLIFQLTDAPALPSQNIPRDIASRKPYLRGETLHLLLDAAGLTLNDVKDRITRIGRPARSGGGITNPHFPTGTELQEKRARLIAIALSDGHIHHRNSQFTYIEKNPQRREYVTRLIREIFGQAHIREDPNPHLTPRIHVTVAVGRALQHWGIPAGDKHLHPNLRLPQTVREAPPHAKRAYLSEVIPEDGWFTITSSGKPTFGISRSTVLDPGIRTRGPDYDLGRSLPKELKDFIRRHGREQTIADTGKTTKSIPRGKLERMADDPDPKISRPAIQLLNIAEQTPCRLLEDEENLCKDLGINTRKIELMDVKIHESGRVSATWRLETKSETDALRWALLAPPASEPKREKVERWLQTIPHTAGEARRRLKEEGRL